MAQNWMHESVSKGAFARFAARLQDTGATLHSVIVYERGEQLVHYGAAPYTCQDRRELYSMSKSFTATAVGVAYDRGLLSPEDAVLRWFPEFAPLCAQDERWQHMKLRHLLTMSTGHAACVMDRMSTAEDSARAFFEQPLSVEPGEMFVYNTGATCLLAEVVRRATGQSVPQLLAQTVFTALGIDDFEWGTNLDGRCQGGVSLRLRCEDVVKLGLLYLNEGRWNGEQVLSREWVAMATAKQIDNAHNGTNAGRKDWQAGYGFQFWRNLQEGYRADGACGQLCVVLPERQIVVAMLAETKDMQSEVDVLWAFLNEMHSGEDGALPKGYAPQGKLSAETFDSGWRQLEENPVGLRSVRVRVENRSATAWLADDRGVQTLRADDGSWTQNTLWYKRLRPALVHMMPREEAQEIRLMAAAHTEGANVIIECRSTNTPHYFEWRFEFSGGLLHMKLIPQREVFGPEQSIEEEKQKA